jgi:hypothetical protein
LKQLRKNVEEFRRNITATNSSEPRIDHIGEGRENIYKNFDDFFDEYGDSDLSKDELRRIYDENVFADFSELHRPIFKMKQKFSYKF